MRAIGQLQYLASSTQLKHNWSTLTIFILEAALSLVVQKATSCSNGLISTMDLESTEEQRDEQTDKSTTDLLTLSHEKTSDIREFSPTCLEHAPIVACTGFQTNVVTIRRRGRGRGRGRRREGEREGGREREKERSPKGRKRREGGRDPSVCVYVVLVFHSVCFQCLSSILVSGNDVSCSTHLVFKSLTWRDSLSVRRCASIAAAIIEKVQYAHITGIIIYYTTILQDNTIDK